MCSGFENESKKKKLWVESTDQERLKAAKRCNKCLKAVHYFGVVLICVSYAVSSPLWIFWGLGFAAKLLISLSVAWIEPVVDRLFRLVTLLTLWKYRKSKGFGGDMDCMGLVPTMKVYVNGHWCEKNSVEKSDE